MPTVSDTPEHAERLRRLALVSLWIFPVLWTVNLLVARVAPGVISPNMLALGRWGLVGAFLAFVTRRELWDKRHIVRAHAWRYVILGACGMWICGAWVYLAGQTTQALNISLIYSSSPVLIAIGAVWFMKESMGPPQIAGVVLCLVGVVHVIVKGQWQQLQAVEFTTGDAWIAAASLAWAAYTLLQKHWKSEFSASAHLAMICWGGVLVIAPFALLEATVWGMPDWSMKATWMVLATALFPGLGAYWMYGWTQRILGASKVSVTLFLGPLYTAIMATLVLQEALSTHHFVGAALILPGVALVTLVKARR